MKKDMNNVEKSLMIPEKENIFKKIFKWVQNLFNKKENNKYFEEPIAPQIQNITIPKSVKIPIRLEEEEEIDENSMEYLYKLSDAELDDLEKLYDTQMEDAKNEIARLDNILEEYKQSIKKLQGKIAEDNI